MPGRPGPPGPPGPRPWLRARAPQGPASSVSESALLLLFRAEGHGCNGYSAPEPSRIGRRLDRAVWAAASAGGASPARTKTGEPGYGAAQVAVTGTVLEVAGVYLASPG